jgi:hypothetical protein
MRGVAVGELAGRLARRDADINREVADGLLEELCRSKYAEFKEVDEVAGLVKTRVELAEERVREEMTGQIKTRVELIAGDGASGNPGDPADR